MIRLRHRWAAAVAVVGCAVSMVAAAAPADATHFRYGNSTWKSLGGNSVQFTVDDGFRRSGYSECYDPTTNSVSVPCSGSDGYPEPGDIISEDVGETEFDFGDMTQAPAGPDGALLFLVDSVDPTNDVLQGRALDSSALPTISTAIDHTYAAAGTYTAFTDSCCRLDSLQGGNADGEYRVETIVDAGSGNNAPVSNLPDIVTCVQGQVCNFQIPASDPDGDAITYRFSTDAEDATLVQPPGATVSSAGLYSWDNTAQTNPEGLWATQVAIEDHDSGGAVKSKISLDFIINLVSPSTTTDQPPSFTQASPACGATVAATVGQTTSFTVSAQDPDVGDTVTLNASGLPNGSSTVPVLPTTGAPGATVSATFSWTPSATDVGDHVVNFIASDPSGLSTLCSLTLSVTNATAQPVTLTTTLTGGGQSGATITTSSGVPVTDTASLAGAKAAGATGTISYNVYSDSGCTMLVSAAGGGSVSGGVAASSSPQTLAPGTYYWTATYSGDSQNQTATSACGSEVLTVTPANQCPNTAPVLDKRVSADFGSPKSSYTAPKLTTAGGGELVLAFTEADGPYAPTQYVTSVAGGGLTWTLARRSNTTWGTTEVWQAYATAPLANAVITAQLKYAYDGSISVAAFKGSANHLGAVAKAAGTSGNPKVSIIPTTCGSLIWAAGHDWTSSPVVTPVAGQTFPHLFVDTRVKDSFWTQKRSAPTSSTKPVTIAVTGPTTDRWTYAAVEIVPAPAA